MKLYIQVREDGVVTDVITYPHGDYAEIEHELPLPDGCIGGWHRWDGTTFLFDQALYDAIHGEGQTSQEPDPAEMEEALNLLGVTTRETHT